MRLALLALCNSDVIEDCRLSDSVNMFSVGESLLLRIILTFFGFDCYSALIFISASNSVVKALCNALRGGHKNGSQHEVNMPLGAAQR